jgi:NADH-quinone oxidoreductase subunit J
MERIIFYVIAMIMIVFAVMSVTSRNIMRAIVYLLFVMLGLAGIYFMIDFFFLGAVQMTVYAGGIIILYITSIMLVERIGEPLDKPKQLQLIIAAALTSLGIGATLFAIYDYDFVEVTQEKSTTIAEVGRALLNYGDNGFILPFEVISMLLLAAMVGAIVIAKSYNKKETSK